MHQSTTPRLGPLAASAGARARPWDQHRLSSVGKREAKLQPRVRVPAYLSDPSQHQWVNESNQWAPASSQYGAFAAAAGSAPGGTQVLKVHRTEASGRAAFERGDCDNPWQRSSGAIGSHCGRDSLGPVDLAAEQASRSGRDKKEAADTLRWVPRPEDPYGKAAEARNRAAFMEEQATAKVGQAR